MKRILFALAMAIVGLSALPAAATPIVITYKLDNVTFLDGGTASGGFTAVFDTTSWSNTFSQLLALDITTTSGTALTGTHYTNILSWGASTAGPSAPLGQASPFLSISILQLGTPDQVLFLGYDQSIPITATTTLQLLDTNQIPGGELQLNPAIWRGWATGSLVPVTEVPEPQTWAILAAGFSLMIWCLRRRKPVSA